MLPLNKAKFDHRVKTIMGHLRRVLKEVEEDPSSSYGQLHSIQRSVQQASMFIVKDLLDQINVVQKDKTERAVNELYDCLGFHRDEFPAKHDIRLK